MLLFAIILTCSRGWAAQESTAITDKAHPTPQVPAIMELGVMGLSVHGFEEDPIYYKNMPHRLDDKARLVTNAEIFGTYKRQNKDQIVGSFGRDCYDQTAAFLGYGPLWQPTPYLDYGFVVGWYYRKTHDIQYKGETRKIKEFYTLDMGNGNQFVPLPLANVALNLPLAKTTALSLNVGSNYFLTHIVATFKVRLPSGKESLFQ